MHEKAWVSSQIRDYRRSAGFATKANVKICFDNLKYIKTYNIFAMHLFPFDLIPIEMIMRREEQINFCSKSKTAKSH
ncbi:hypothetical protein CKK33_04025 [Mucilaginibacter sp. MD40]|nr:hypothetical protein CKK33_04025 [Mucilaginibacter sp. MD40]